MIQFYKRAILLLLLGVALISLISWVFLSYFYVSVPLLPSDQNALPWIVDTLTDHQSGGKSSVTVNRSDDVLDYDFLLTNDVRFPYAGLAVDFEEALGHRVDLSQYVTARFEVRCEPSNVLSFVLYARDETLPDASVSGRYRVPSRYFACDSHWSAIEINLNQLELPEWWLRMNGLSLSEQSYDISQVGSFAFAISLQSPVQTPSNVQIQKLSLNGYDHRYLYALIGTICVLVLAGLFFLMKAYRRAVAEDVKTRILSDRPFLSYQKLSISSRRDTEVEELLKFFANEYANPNLKLDWVASSVGINRTKINEILNAELGLSFSSYVNKLRLTEAARLLSDKGHQASITEICHKVGYNSVSYFSALFKKEYGCTPKAFKSLSSIDCNQDHKP